MANKPHNPLEGSRPDLVLDLSGDSVDELVSIIVVHNDKPEYLSVCLQTISICSVNNNYEIIVVDNGSTRQDAKDYLDALDDEHIKIIRNERNVYWTKAANQGAKAADKKSSYLVFMHADTCVLNPAWLDLLIGISDSSESGVVGTQMHHYVMQDQKIDYVQDWCMLVTRKCWEDVGPFNEALPHIGASFLFTLAAQGKKYQPRCIKASVVHHYHVSGLDISMYERFAEQAALEIPAQMRKMPEISSLVKTS
jgi:GT2 family glycosyltransferase